MNGFKRFIGYVGVFLVIIILIGALLISALSFKPQKNAVHFEGYAPEDTKLIVKDGSLALLEGGSLETASPLLFEVRTIALAATLAFSFIASLLLISGKPRKKEPTPKDPS
jgi:hypothetical protein